MFLSQSSFSPRPYPRTDRTCLPSFSPPQGKWRLARGGAGGCISAQHLGCPWQEGESVSWVPLTGSPPSSTKHRPLCWAKTWGPGQFLRGSWNRLLHPDRTSRKGIWGPFSVADREWGAGIHMVLTEEPLLPLKEQSRSQTQSSLNTVYTLTSGPLSLLHRLLETHTPQVSTTTPRVTLY